MTRRQAHLSQEQLQDPLNLLNSLPGGKEMVNLSPKVNGGGKSLPLLTSGNSVQEWSGRADSNRRLPAPKAGALTRLRHVPTLTESNQLPPEAGQDLPQGG